MPKPTRKQVRSEDAGRQMDVWVATYITHYPKEWGPPPSYSTNPVLADIVIDRMQEQGYSYLLYGVSPYSSVMPGNVCIFIKSVHPPTLLDLQSEQAGHAPERPLAICRAAVLAVIGEKDIV